MVSYRDKRRFGDNMNTPTSAHSEVHLESRISSVETAVSHIEIGMDDIKSTIHSGFSEIRRDIDRQSETSRPKVVQWAGWAAVVLIVLGMFGSGYVRDLGKAEEEIAVIHKNFHEFRQREAVVEATHTARLGHIKEQMNYEIPRWHAHMLENAGLEAALEQRVSAIERNVFTRKIQVEYNNGRPANKFERGRPENGNIQ